MGRIPTFSPHQPKFGAQARLTDGELNKLSIKAKENLDAGKTILLPDKFALTQDKGDDKLILIPRTERRPKLLKARAGLIKPEALAAQQVAEAALKGTFLSKVDKNEIVATTNGHTPLARFDAANYWAFKTYGSLRESSIVPKEALPKKPEKVLAQASLIDAGIYQAGKGEHTQGYVYPQGRQYLKSPPPNALSTKAPKFRLEIPTSTH